MRERRADEARVGVMQRRHRVEQVRETACAVLERGDRVVVGRERVAELHAHAARGHLADDLDVARDFRRERDDADRRDRQVLEHLVEHGRHGRVGLRAELAGVDVRPFEMHAEHAGTARRAGPRGGAEIRDDFHQFVARRGHRRREQARRAELRMRADDRFDRVAAFHHVGAAAAMHVQVDEAGQDVRRVVLRGIDGRAVERGDAAVLAIERTVNPAVGGEDVSVQHDVLLMIW